MKFEVSEDSLSSHSEALSFYCLPDFEQGPRNSIVNMAQNTVEKLMLHFDVS